MEPMEGACDGAPEAAYRRATRGVRQATAAAPGSAVPQVRRGVDRLAHKYALKLASLCLGGVSSRL